MEMSAKMYRVIVSFLKIGVREKIFYLLKEMNFNPILATFIAQCD
jgi:hypothetical protein